MDSLIEPVTRIFLEPHTLCPMQLIDPGGVACVFGGEAVIR